MDVPPVGARAVTRTRALAAAVAGLVAFVVLAAGVLTDFGPLLRVDAVVSSALYAGDDRAAALDGLLELLTAPGLSGVRLLLLLPVLAWLVSRRAWSTAAWVLTAAALIGPLTAVVKDVVGRIRPPFANGGVRYESLSFPSGHSSGIATLATVALVLAWPRLTAPVRHAALVGAVVLVVVVGLTRIWLGVHYLSDVVGGWSLGLAWTLAVALLFDALPGGRTALPATGGSLSRRAS